MPEEILELLKPEYVTPLVVFLAHESCEENGNVFEAGGGWYGTVQSYRSVGKAIASATAENIRDSWKQITSMDGSRHFESSKDASGDLISVASELKESTTTAANKASAVGSSNVKSAALFKEMNDGLKDNMDKVKNMKAIVLYIITDGKKEIARYTLDLKNQPFGVYEGDVKNGEKPITTLTVADEDFVQLSTGKLNAQKAFMAGKLKVKGNIMLLQKLSTIAEKKAKL